MLLVLFAAAACSDSQSGGGETNRSVAASGNASSAAAGKSSNTPGIAGAPNGQGGITQSTATPGPASSNGGVVNASGTSSLGGAPSFGGVQANGGALPTPGGGRGTLPNGGTKSSNSGSVGGATSTGGARNNAGNSAIGGAKTSGGAPAAAGRNAAGAPSTGTATGTAGAKGTNVCGNAAEDATATLKCPEGQMIDAVVFASYGTPTGSCGNFTAGSCAASSSKSTVETTCVGRSSCTVTASNDTFGDPCRSTTKRLSVEVSCVVGTPTVTPDPPVASDGPYKGIANSPASQIAALGATWCYNWGTTPKSTDCADPYFVPMVWGSGDVANAIKAIGKAGYTTVLGFNEPNKTDQANMSVADAIALWPEMTSDPNIRVGSPAVSDDGRSWLESFMTQVKSKGLRVDFIAMHWYGWNAGSCTASQLEGAVKWASQWNLPIWITEFGCMGSSNPDEQTLLKFFNDAIPMLAKHPLVERYAWYPWNTYNELYKTQTGSAATMTELGKAFAAAPQYRQ